LALSAFSIAYRDRQQLRLTAATIVDIVVFLAGTAMNDVTQILSRIESGDPGATEQLLPLVYQELRRLARAQMANERAEHTPMVARTARRGG
jgi:Flp pilus assembly protein CpaB